MLNTWQVIALSMALGAVASGQRLYWGLVGGTNLTPDFPHYDLSTPPDAFGNLGSDFQHLPGPHTAIWGGLLEVQLTGNFAVELNALHRSFPGDSISTVFPASGQAVITRFNFPSANTWEFPVMMKWSLPSPLMWGRVRPFVEGGPAFRTSQDDRSTQPSQFGLTAGVGAAVHFGKLRVAPAIRYNAGKRTQAPEFSHQGRSG